MLQLNGSMYLSNNLTTKKRRKEKITVKKVKNSIKLSQTTDAV